MTYAVIAYLLAFQPFLTILYAQNALILVKCVSPATDRHFANAHTF